MWSNVVAKWLNTDQPQDKNLSKIEGDYLNYTPITCMKPPFLFIILRRKFN